MASSSSSKVYDGTQYVESCGAVVFDNSKQKVCLPLRRRAKEDGSQEEAWVLPKGRRHCGEHRYAAALREVEEETGYACHLQSLNMVTRAPAAQEPEAATTGKPRPCRTYTEPFMVTHRNKQDGYLKLIYWYLAVADAQMTAGEETFTPRFFEPEEALATITFPDERKVLEEGIRLMRGGC
ncbi:NUDIX domain-containing protein [Apiospora aurea]|uniref:NUDIX domain-containing protein n=1 Tax=Apiospora aurea TaxID=335848 RepID=A0ABR1QH07_9PEZI